MVIKWYWLVAAGVLVALVVVWLCLGRDRDTMRRQISLETPIRMVEAAAMGIPVDIVRTQKELEAVMRARQETENADREQSDVSDEIADTSPRDTSPRDTIVRAYEAASVSAEQVRHEAHRYGLTVTSAVQSPRLPRREINVQSPRLPRRDGAVVPKQPEDVNSGVDLTPRLPAKLQKSSATSVDLPASTSVPATKEVKRREHYYQKLTKIAAERVFGVEFEENVRPPWMKSPDTGRCLELDLYNDEIKVAIEYNGYQHYVFPNKWHPETKEGVKAFIRGVRNDELKPILCDKHGVYLIVVPYSAHDTSERALEQIEAFLRYYHPDEQARRLKEDSRALGTQYSSQPDVVVTSHSLLDDDEVTRVDEDGD